jgi:hypothetical protein
MKRRVKFHLPFTSIIRRFNVYGSGHCKYIPIYIQQDATLHSLFISKNCSTCFGWYFRPSSGEHTTMSTASGICHTVTASDDGWKYHPKHVEQFPDINKLCNAASCWIYIGILLGAHPILHISRIRVKYETEVTKSSAKIITLLSGRAWPLLRQLHQDQSNNHLSLLAGQQFWCV